MVDPVQLVLGALVLWAPGLTWTWALAPELDWAKFAFASVIVAATVQPAAMYVLNVFLGVPIAPMNYVLLSLGLALLGLGWGLRPRLEAAWGTV
jgi:hypothetical protein